MGARSAPELAQWRTSPYSVRYYAYVHAPTTVAACRINMASGTYPGLSITVDGYTTGAYTDILEGMTVLVGSSAGADDYGRTRVRAASDGTVSTSTTINVGRYSKGTRDGELTITDNAYVTVLDLRMVWATPPHIDDNEITYKDGSFAFDATKAQPPIASVDTGDIFEIVATSGDSASLSIPCTATATHPDATSTLSYVLTVADATPSSRSGSATSGIQFTPTAMSVPVGKRYGKLQVTDSLGNVTTQYFFIVVEYEGSANLLTGFEIVRWTERADGQDMQIRVSNPLPYSTYPDGTEVLIRQRERFGTTVGSVVEDDEVIFAGWIGSEQNEGSAARRGFIGRTTLTLVDAAGRLKLLPGFPMVVERKASPTQWEHLEAANLDRYVWHILRWHSNAAARVPFTWSGTGDDYPFATLGSDGQSLWDQAHTRTQAIAYVLTCDHRGRLAMRGDPNILPTATQASTWSLPTSRTTTPTLTVTTGDWKSYRFAYTRAPRVHWNWGEAIVGEAVDADSAEIGTVFCVAPGSAPGQGVVAQTSGQQLVSSQAELNVREWNRYIARMNARHGYVETSVRGGSAGIHPANMEWVQFDIDADTAAPRGRTFSNQKFLPIEVSYSVNHRNGTREARYSLEIEVSESGAAESYYPPQDDGYVYLPTTPITLPPIGTGVPTMSLIPYTEDVVPTKLFMGAATSSQAAIATGITTGGTLIYTEISTGLTGNTIWGSSDPFNYGTMNLLQDTGIYRATPYSFSSWSLVANNATIFGNATRVGNKLIMSINRRNWMYAISGTSMSAWSTDNGLTWVNNGGTSGSSTGPFNMDAVVSPHNDGSSTTGWMYKCVYTGGGVNTIYKSTDWGQTWSSISTITPGAAWISGRLNIPYKKSDGTANSNDSSQVLYWQGGLGHSANTGYIYISTDAGATWSIHAGGSGSGIYVPASSYGGTSIQTFTHDGGVIISGNLLTGAGGSFVGLRVEDDGSLISNAGLISSGSSYLNSVCVNGFSYHRLAALMWNQAGSAAELNYTFDGGVNTYSANLPSFFTGSPKLIGYAEWALVDFQR